MHVEHGGPGATATRLRRRPGTSRRINGSISALAIGGATSVAVALLAGDTGAVVLPMLAMLIVAATYAIVLYRRDGRLPIFEPASLAVAATVVYGVYPLGNFIAGGLTWSAYGDNRLLQLARDPADVAAFGWRYAWYLATFVITYLVIRGASGVRTTDLRRPSRATTASIVLIAVFNWLLLAAIARAYGIQYSPGYAEVAEGSIPVVSNLPLFVAQMSQNLLSIQLLLQQLLVVLLLLEWRRHIWARFALVGFLLFVTLDVTVTRGSRTAAVMLLLSTGLLYHRLVRPMKLVAVTTAGMALLIGVIAYGIVRDLRNYHEPVSYLTAGNEFQSIFGTPFDLRDRMRTGELVDIPWQIYWADLLALVPSQLLPFEKIDPSIWYLEVANIRTTGYAFGLLAQVVVGYDWVELILRGVVLALVLALLQRWYVRRVESFWPTIVVMFLSTWMYYTIRQSTFSVLYFLVYRFVPAMLVVQGLSILIARTARPVRKSSS